jgi:hypothetical protein
LSSCSGALPDWPSSKISQKRNGSVGVTRCAHNVRVRNQLLYSLMSDVFLRKKEEARYRQPTDVQEPKASYAAVLTGRCTGADTVACCCSNSLKVRCCKGEELLVGEYEICWNLKC